MQHTEPVALSVGILLEDGTQVRDLTLTNQTQRITRAAKKHPDFPRAADDFERGLVVFGHQLSSPLLGDNPVTLDQMLDLDEIDIDLIAEADARLRERIRRFPDSAKGADPGTADDGAALEGSDFC